MTLKRLVRPPGFDAGPFAPAEAVDGDLRLPTPGSTHGVLLPTGYSITPNELAEDSGPKVCYEKEVLP
jgi:hypothetical protein